MHAATLRGTPRCGKVFTLDPDPSVVRHLTAYGGLNRLGEPNYRIVWGGSRLAWRAGKWGDVGPVGCRLVHRYPQRNRFHIEAWHPAEFYGSPLQWEMTCSALVEGQWMPTLGGYPVRGDYESIDVVEDIDGAGVSRFLSPTHTYVEYVVALHRIATHMVRSEILAREEQLQEKREAAQTQGYIDRMDEVTPSFFGPTVSLAGLNVPGAAH